MTPKTQLNLAKWLAAVKLTFNQATILRACPISQVNITRDLGLSVAGVSTAITTLSNRGLVYRAENVDDRRIAIIHLTERGTNLVNAMEEVLDCSDPEEFDIDKRIKDSLEQDELQPPPE